MNAINNLPALQQSLASLTAQTKPARPSPDAAGDSDADSLTLSGAAASVGAQNTSSALQNPDEALQLTGWAASFITGQPAQALQTQPMQGSEGIVGLLGQA